MKRIIYVFLNENLHMSPGKAAAQAAHATTLVDKVDWETADDRAIVVLGAMNGQHINNIQEYFAERGVATYKVIDEMTDAGPHQITALATEPFEDTETVREKFSNYELYANKDYVTAHEYNELVDFHNNIAKVDINKINEQQEVIDEIPRVVLQSIMVGAIIPAFIAIIWYLLTR